MAGGEEKRDTGTQKQTHNAQGVTLLAGAHGQGPLLLLVAELGAAAQVQGLRVLADVAHLQAQQAALLQRRAQGGQQERPHPVGGVHHQARGWGGCLGGGIAVTGAQGGQAVDQALAKSSAGALQGGLVQGKPVLGEVRHAVVNLWGGGGLWEGKGHAVLSQEGNTAAQLLQELRSAGVGWLLS